MSRRIHFTKMHGTGNDFILIDNRSHFFTGEEHELFRKLCHRRFGIGADGLMLIDFSSPEFFELKYFNADGKTAEMCGNGARCAVYFVYLLSQQNHQFEFKVCGQKYRGEVKNKDWVKIYWNFNPIIQNIDELENVVSHEFAHYAFINSGVPHLILETKKPIDQIDVVKMGKYFRYHPYFLPQGTNVNFISINQNGVQVRTYERGVEGETLSCGTGALAVACAGVLWDKIQLPVKVFTRGGMLRVGKDNSTGKLWLEGPVKTVFYGFFEQQYFDEFKIKILETE